MIGIVPIIIAIIVSIALMTLAERKIMGSSQRRVGPNRVGIMGIVQPIADGMKLVMKETIVPSRSNEMIFIVSPIIVISTSILGWLVIPWNKTNVITIVSDSSLIYIIAVSSVGIYGVLYGGIAANSKYAIIGAIRSTSQLISYEIIIGIIIIGIVVISTDGINSSLNISQIIKTQEGIWNCIPNLPIFIVWLIGILAETNRTPMDLPEAESELVAGFVTEHSGLPFAYYYLGEYGSILLMSVITTIVFMGELKNIKIVIIVIYFIWIRATLPRLKYIGLISICWVKLMPIVIGYISLAVSMKII